MENPKIKANIEWLPRDWEIAIVRAGPLLDKFGDPFEFVCTVMRKDDQAIIKGACGKRYSAATFKAIKELMEKERILNVTWERKNNEPRIVIKKL